MEPPGGPTSATRPPDLAPAEPARTRRGVPARPLISRARTPTTGCWPGIGRRRRSARPASAPRQTSAERRRPHRRIAGHGLSSVTLPGADRYATLFRNGPWSQLPARREPTCGSSTLQVVRARYCSMLAQNTRSNGRPRIDCFYVQRPRRRMLAWRALAARAASAKQPPDRHRSAAGPARRGASANHSACWPGYRRRHFERRTLRQDSCWELLPGSGCLLRSAAALSGSGVMAGRRAGR